MSAEYFELELRSRSGHEKRVQEPLFCVIIRQMLADIGRFLAISGCWKMTCFESVFCVINRKKLTQVDRFAGLARAAKVGRLSQIKTRTG